MRQGDAVEAARRAVGPLLRAACMDDWVGRVTISDAPPEDPDNASHISGDLQEGIAEIQIDGPWAENADVVALSVALCISEVVLLPLSGVKNLIDLLLPEGDEQAAHMANAIWGAANDEIVSSMADQLLRSARLDYQGAVPGTALTS